MPKNPFNFVTPNQRQTGMDQIILEKRRKLYETAKFTHPERWSKGIRNWTLPDEVWLNPERKDTTTNITRVLKPWVFCSKATIDTSNVKSPFSLRTRDYH